jgi:hypothetical protein
LQAISLITEYKDNEFSSYLYSGEFLPKYYNDEVSTYKDVFLKDIETMEQKGLLSDDPELKKIKELLTQ